MKEPTYDLQRDILEVVRQDAGYLRNELAKPKPDLDMVVNWAEGIAKDARLSKQLIHVQRLANAIRIDERYAKRRKS